MYTRRIDFTNIIKSFAFLKIDINITSDQFRTARKMYKQIIAESPCNHRRILLTHRLYQNFLYSAFVCGAYFSCNGLNLL